MRITGGSLRGRRLHAPRTSAIRPMREAVRLALFHLWGERVAESRFLDLFAGTGSVGLEALSRGAARATFVEALPEALRILRANLRELGLQARARVLAQDVFRALKRLEGERFDLVFVGPPYGRGLAERALAALAQADLVCEGGLVAVEVFFKEQLAARYGALTERDRRRYGDNLLVFYARMKDGPRGHP